MPRNVDGEYEILLGNKQLLSVFFIVVILLAVFFSMGYVLGRRSPVATAQSRPEAILPAPVTSPNGFAETVAPIAAPAQAAASAPDVGAQEKRPAQPQEPPAAAPPKAVASQPAAASLVAPAEGQIYLQATAAKRLDAELVAGVLKKKGLPVVLAPGPSEGVVRVLVGPFANSEALGKARRELVAAGFDKPFTRKY